VTAASDTYEQKLQSEISKSSAPALFQVNGPTGLANWKDYCLDLTGSKVLGELANDALKLEGDGKVYAIDYVEEDYGIIYNKDLLTKAGYSADDIKDFDSLKKVADDIQARKAELGVEGAFTSAGMDSSSNWRYTTHLANMPIHYEFKDENEDDTDAIKGTYLPQYKQIFDLYLTDSTCDPSQVASKTGDDAVNEFLNGKAVFYQNGTWAYKDIAALGDDKIGMIPLYIGVKGEDKQGMCSGGENYWCVNSQASADDQAATLEFLNWVVTDDEAREAGAVAHGDDAGREEAEVLGDEGQLAQVALEFVEKRHAGPLGPRAVAGVGGTERHLPVGLEPAEVVEAHEVVHGERGAHAALPPAVAIRRHRAPVVDRVAPVLAGGREIVRRGAGDARGGAVGRGLEELGLRPHLDGVARDVDGHVADDEDSAGVRVLLERGPLPRKEVLRHPVVADAPRVGGGDGLGRGAGAARLGRPLPVGAQAELLLRGHELAVGVEPVGVGREELVVIVGRGGGEAAGCGVEDRAARAEDAAVVHARGVVAEVGAVELRAGQEAV